MKIDIAESRLRAALGICLVRRSATSTWTALVIHDQERGLRARYHLVEGVR